MATKQRVTIVGAGINGLVAANYLQRNGFDVTLLERKATPGGACSVSTFAAGGRTYEYPNGATVFGMMQDFVWEETGLSGRLAGQAVTHPSMVYFESHARPGLLHDDAGDFAREAKELWGESGDVAGFLADLDRVAAFLSAGYRTGQVPTLERAKERLGEATAERWIAGSAQALLDRYFTSDEMKIVFAMDVTESGPVPLSSPYSAFVIPLMASGTVFGGKWGYVSGGIRAVTDTLAAIDRELGVRIVTSAQVLSVSPSSLEVTYRSPEGEGRCPGDQVIFATDPLSASGLLDDPELRARVTGQRLLGTSGKVAMAFRKPVRWKDSTGLEGFDTAFRFIVCSPTLSEFDRAAQSVVSGERDFTPGYLEIYCEGAGLRKLGTPRDHDSVSVFFKHLACSRTGEELPEVRQAVLEKVLARVENPEDFAASVLVTPKDLKREFFFPEGNIDHIELSDGQTFFSRTYSANPFASFYQLGRHERIRYCGSGAYPCGSVAGTPGYMCARQLIDSGK